MPGKIAIDAMGGDHAPKEIVEGSLIALNNNEDMNLVLVGDEEQIRKHIPADLDESRLEIVHTGQMITMDDSPKKALTEKPDASILVAARLVNDGIADALVSAGNTGAVVLASAQSLPMIAGIERSALAAIYPVAKFYRSSRGFALMLDVGATIHCTPNQLVHFAYMGSYYAQQVLDIPDPHVAILNIGEEETKGGETLTKTYQYLKEADGLNFIGNVEGKDIPKGYADVIITEGFVGNVVLKMFEGISEVVMDMGKYAFKQKWTWKIGLALLSTGVKRLKEKTDYSEYGGAPILGFKKLIIKAHGRSNAKAISNAIRIAELSVKNEVCDHIAESVDEFNQKHRIDFIDI